MRRSLLLWSLNKIQKVGIDEDTISIFGDADGHWYRSFSLFLGLRPGRVECQQQQLRQREQRCGGPAEILKAFPH